MIIKRIIVLMFICLGESVELICYELLLIYLFCIMFLYILIYNLTSILFIKIFANTKFIISDTFYYFKEIFLCFKVNII